MGQNVTASGTSTNGFIETPTGYLGGSPYQPNKITYTASFNTSGTAADQVNLTHRKTYSLAATPTVLNLFDGSLLDPLGNTCAFRRVRRIRVRNRSTTDGQNVLMGYSTTTANAWTGIVTNPGQITVFPSTAAGNDGWVEVAAPGTTGAAVSTSNKLLQLDPGANTVSVDVEIDGADA